MRSDGEFAPSSSFPLQKEDSSLFFVISLHMVDAPSILETATEAVNMTRHVINEICHRYTARFHFHTLSSVLRILPQAKSSFMLRPVHITAQPKVLLEMQSDVSFPPNHRCDVLNTSQSKLQH